MSKSLSRLLSATLFAGCAPKTTSDQSDTGAATSGSARIGDGRSILANALVGVLGSLIVGAIAGNGAVFGTVSGVALLWAVLGSVVAIGLFNLVRQRAYR